jgi:hypothetical protein
MGAFLATPFWKNRESPGYPPLPHPLNAATGAGFAKMVCKILRPKGLEVMILRTRELGLVRDFCLRRLRHGYDLLFEF